MDFRYEVTAGAFYNGDSFDGTASDIESTGPVIWTARTPATVACILRLKGNSILHSSKSGS